MANTQSMCTSFLGELMLGQHQLGTSTIVSRGNLTSPTTDTVKAALYLASATINAGTTAYTATGEVSGTNYTAGGVTVSYTHLRAHETPEHLVCRLLLEKREGTVDNENELTTWVEYWLEGELVHRSAHVTLKKAPTFAGAETASFA